MEKEAVLQHLRDTLEAKDLMGLCNFRLGAISPPAILDEDLGFKKTWRQVVEATSKWLTAMAMAKVKEETVQIRKDT